MPHKYWRLKFFTSTGGVGTDIWLDEVSFRDAADNDLSVGGTAIASSEYSSSYAAALAFDKTLANEGWASQSGQAYFPAWIGYNHPTAVDVDSVLITCPETSSSYGELPVPRFTVLEYSDNGSTWEQAGDSVALAAGEITPGAVFRLRPAYFNENLKLVESLPVRVGGTPHAQNSLGSRLAAGGWYRVDYITGGSGVISGTVTIENIPGSRRVRLYRKHDGMLIRETWSAANGAYSFTNIDPAWEYFVVAHDHLRVYNGVIQDMITP